MRYTGLILFIICIMLFGCMGRPTPIPDMGSDEAGLYSSRCGACHSVPHPKRHTARQWEHIIGVMEKELSHRNMPALTAEEKETILDYLKRHSR